MRFWSRPPAAAVSLVFALAAGCGYVGPIAPPSPDIPEPVNNLAAVERGDRLTVTFSAPARTTDAQVIKRFSQIELRVGPANDPFDPEKWAQSAKRYDVPLPPNPNQDDPRPEPLTVQIPAADWIGQKVAVAVRTASRSGNHFSQWSSPATLDVIEPLQPPKPKADATRDGYKLTWTAQRAGIHYDVLRQGGGDKTPISVGVAETPEFVDVTSQWDVAYTYFVVAKTAGSESLWSEGVPVNHPDTFAPTVPAGVTALAGPDSIELTWSRSPEADLKAYRIYRGVGEAPLEPLPDLTNLPTFSDRKIERGKKYRYAISAIDTKNNESEKSAVAEVSF